MTDALRDFFAWLDGFGERAPLDELVRRLQALPIGLDDVAGFVRFGRHGYQRNLMRGGLAYHALVLCWLAGQRSPIHDHRAASCAVRVLAGVASETTFARTPEGLVYPTGTRRLAAGSVCGSQDADIHQMSNLQPPGHDLVTLHVYSPPLLVMGRYSLTEPTVGEFVDPVVEFALGAGI